MDHPPPAPGSVQFRTLWRDWVAIERNLAGLAGPLADALHNSRPVHSTEFHRRVVLPLRRDVHNGRRPRAAVRAALGDLSEQIPLLSRWLELLNIRDRLCAELPVIAQRALAAERAALSTVCGVQPLRQAVALTSRDLLRAVDRAAITGANADGRARKSEPTVLRYALRATSKTSPLSWFTFVAWGALGDGDGDGLDGLTPVATSRANRALTTALVRVLLATPDFRHRLPHRLAPATSLTDGRVGYRRDMPAGSGIDMREEQVTVPATAAIRLVLARLAEAGTAGVAPTLLAQQLAGRLPAEPERARVLAETYFDRLAVEQLLLPIGPVDPQAEDVLPALAGWLDAQSRSDLAGLLRVIDRDSRRVADLAAQDRPEALRVLTEAWRSAFAAVGAQAPQVSPVTEDVAAAKPVRLGRRHGTHVRTDLARLAPLVELFDIGAVLRRLIRDRLVAEAGPGGSCRLADLVTDTARLWSAMRRVEPDGTIATLTDADPPLPAEVCELARLRREVTTAIRAAASADGAQVWLSDQLLTEATAALPQWLRARPASYSYFVQPFRDGAETAWCINHISGGFGRFTSRFLDLIDLSAARAVAAQLHRALPGGRIAQYRPVAHSNANLHPLLVDDEVGEDPAWATLLADQLELVHDQVTDQVRIRVAGTGEQLDVLYLGFIVPFVLPDRLAPLYFDHGFANSSLVHLAPRAVVGSGEHRATRRLRLRYANLVLARTAWSLNAATAASLRTALERDGDVPVASAARWAARLGLPERVFVAADRRPFPRRAVDSPTADRRPKPQYVDLGNPLHLRCLPHLLARHHGPIHITEALPVPGEGPAGRRTLELIVETYRLSAPR